METADVDSLIDDLASNIDDLDESLAPLLKGPLSHQTSKLPLLDQAKLYVLATYAIESILFSSLKVNGVDAKAHPVFQELARVKEYFGKIKTIETSGAGAKRNVSLDKEAAGRFIKAGLAGNDRYDQSRAEQMAREKAGAKRKLEEMGTGTHTRFDGTPKRIKAQDAEQSSSNVVEDEKTKARQGPATTSMKPNGEPNKSKKRRDWTAESQEVNRRLAPGDEDSAEASATQKARSKKSKKPKTSEEALHSPVDPSMNGSEAKSGKKKRKKKKADQSLGDEEVVRVQ